MRLMDLNPDVLYRIFDYCTSEELLELLKAFDIFQGILEDYFNKRILDLLMCGSRNHPCIYKRTHSTISNIHRIGIAKNWVEGSYYEYQYYNHASMFSAKIHLESNNLYLTYANYLRQYKRNTVEPLQRRFKKEIASRTYKSDINDFAKKGNTIFAGQLCGNCFIYENGGLTEQRLHSPSEYMHCVDFAKDLYVTSSDRNAKLWRRSDELGFIQLDLQKELQYSYKSMRLTDDGHRLYGGLYTDMSRRALREIDITTGHEAILNSHSTSIYDLKIKDENILLTANFDTSFRLYDRRTDRDEGIWEDPFDSSFYCLEYDGLYAVLCGTKYHSRVNLYDIRVPRKYIQLYFPARRHDGYENNSPVYSIACDSRYLFVATDHNLRVFDFKVAAVSRDYRAIFKEFRRFRNSIL